MENEINHNKETKEFETLNGLFKDIKYEVDNFKFLVLKPGMMNPDRSRHPDMMIEYVGLNGITEFVLRIQAQGKADNFSLDKYQNYSAIGEFKYILGGLNNLISKAESAKLLSDEDKNLLSSSMFFYYQAKLETITQTLLDIPFEDKEFRDFITPIHNRLKKQK